MNPIDRFPQTVIWSDEDNCYIGYCHALTPAGLCHGDDPVSVLRDLRSIIAGELEERAAKGIPLPSIGGPRVTVKVADAA